MHIKKDIFERLSDPRLILNSPILDVKTLFCFLIAAPAISASVFFWSVTSEPELVKIDRFAFLSRYLVTYRNDGSEMIDVIANWFPTGKCEHCVFDVALFLVAITSAAC